MIIILEIENANKYSCEIECHFKNASNYILEIGRFNEIEVFLI